MKDLSFLLYQSAALVACCLLAPSSVSVAQWSADPNVNNPICTAANDQDTPVVASDGAGGAIFAWVDYRAYPRAQIFAQRITAAGAVQWPENGVVIDTAASGADFAIAADGVGGAIIAWYNYSSGNADIYAQRINAGGVVQWTANGIAISTAQENQTGVVIASDGAGGAIIAWEDFRSGTNNDIYVQRVDANGDTLWTANGIAVCTAAGHQGSAAIVNDGAGGAIIGWQDLRSGTNSDIYAQRINVSGVVQWTADGVAISTATDDQQLVKIVSDGVEGAILTWQDLRSGVSHDIYALRVDANGDVLWTANGVAICTETGTQRFPGIASDGAGGAVIAWDDSRSSTTDNDIYAQRVDANGDTLWTADGVAISTALEGQFTLTIVSDGAGGAIISWMDSRSGEEDIYVQQIDPAGVIQWATDGVAVSTASNSQSSPQMVSDDAGGVIIAWTDARGGSGSDIYASRLFSDGTLPVQLISFTALTNGLNAELRWRTESEVGNYGFEVERRLVPSSKSQVPGPETSNLKPETAWIGIGFVQGSGTSSSPQDYSFVDRQVKPGRYAYRLKQIDQSGSFSYSHAAELEIGLAPVEFSLSQNYPNPFNPTTTIEFTLPEDGRVSLKVFDILGREVAVLLDEERVAGVLHQVSFDASHLAGGTYFYRIVAGNRVKTSKLIVIK